MSSRDPVTPSARGSGNPRLRANSLLLLAAAIWGFAFVAQRIGMRSTEPFTFNSVRFLLGSAALLPFVVRVGGSVSGRSGVTVRAGLLAGLALFAGATLQQMGIVHTTAGKAGFITGLYVLIVPLFGLALGQRIGRRGWAGAVLAVIGLYLLTVTGRLGINPGDVLVFFGAFCWAAHVQIIERFVGRAEPVRLAALQFLVCGLLSAAGALLFESPSLAGVRAAWPAIAYAGILSTAVAFTLQVIAQRHARPSHTAILLSLEAAFAVLGGWIVLGESLTLRGMAGCALMLAGMIVSQTGAKAGEH